MIFGDAVFGASSFGASGFPASPAVLPEQFAAGVPYFDLQLRIWVWRSILLMAGVS